jgi:hypothetical protein
MNTISIIGTAGRQDDAPRINEAIYDAMYAQTLAAISDWNCTRGVSGGAAVADHLAVRAYLEGALQSLTLYLPADFDIDAGRYLEGGKNKDGATANRYHRQFSRSCNVDSFREIIDAIDKGAEVIVKHGFKTRNLYVAKDCSHMLALTFGRFHEPVDLRSTDEGFRSSAAGGLKDGGTAFHGWKDADGKLRNLGVDFLPDHPGFRSSEAAGLRDGGTAHTWRECWKAEVKRHVSLTTMERLLKAAA